MRSLLAALSLCVLALSGNATLASERHTPEGVKFSGPAMAGLASVDDGHPTRFDGGNFHGRVATGERFKSASLAVAHRTLPLHSCIAVRFNGHVVTGVHVNDRGPCATDHCQMTAPFRVRARVLDMTPLLAAKLNFPGLGRVSFWPVACTAI